MLKGFLEGAKKSLEAAESELKGFSSSK